MVVVAAAAQAATGQFEGQVADRCGATGLPCPLARSTAPLHPGDQSHHRQAHVSTAVTHRPSCEVYVNMGISQRICGDLVSRATPELDLSGGAGSILPVISDSL